LWVATKELPRTGGHPFHQRLNQVLDPGAFDEFVEAQCAPFYADKIKGTPPPRFHIVRYVDQVLETWTLTLALGP
jgi:hypothetical protein